VPVEHQPVRPARVTAAEDAIALNDPANAVRLARERDGPASPSARPLLPEESVSTGRQILPALPFLTGCSRPHCDGDATQEESYRTTEADIQGLVGFVAMPSYRLRFTI
jgi:hypothetical protein